MYTINFKSTSYVFEYVLINIIFSNYSFHLFVTLVKVFLV